MNYWLFKSEPDEFSYEDLTKVKSEPWTGIRNYRARNFLRDEVKKGDLVLFYHSSCKPTQIVGIAEVVREAYPDPLAFDENSKYFDPKSNPENPRWVCVDIKAKEKLKHPITLAEAKTEPALKDMMLTQKMCRLSIQTVTEAEFETILQMGGN